MSLFVRVLSIVFCVTGLTGCLKKTENASITTTIPTSKWVDKFNWVQYGNMPLVISVPHGGTIAPDSIPDRTCANITAAVDTYTIELAQAIDSVFNADYKIRPYLVTTNLRRIKLDQNREWAEATCSSSSKTYLWNNFHNSIDTSIRKVLAIYPNCLYIDLHGHGHAIERLELGYLISAASLQNPNTIPNNNQSVSSLLQVSGKTVKQLLTGATAFGSFMAAKGYPSVPSNADPAPQIGDPYFDGGYNTSRFTNSTNYPKVFGWQVEANFTNVRNTPTSRANFAKAFTQSIMSFFKENTTMLPTSFGK